MVLNTNPGIHLSGISDGDLTHCVLVLSVADLPPACVQYRRTRVDPPGCCSVIPSVFFWPATWSAGVAAVTVIRCSTQQVMRVEELDEPFLPGPVALAPDADQMAVML